jgi:hypothetical protein
MRVAVAQTQTGDQKFLTETRQSYAVLKRQGLQQLRASVVPNWAVMFKNVAVKDRPTLIRMASRLRFVVEADATGNFHVTHSIIGPKPAKGPAEALDNIAKGVDLSITGFLMTWAPFMLTYLIPDNLEQFVLQDQETQKVLTYKEREVEVSVVITKDYEIKELSTPQGTVKPILKKEKSGFVLTGYEGNNEDPIAGKVIVNGRIALAAVQGLMLPKTVFLTGKSGETPINFELNFVNYRLKRKA